MSGWPPKKNAAFTWFFVIRDADGDPVVGASALDVEFSIDGGVFADVAGTEVDEGEGLYSCPITAAEMNGDVIGLICKTGTAGAKTAAQVIYTTTRQIDDVAFPVISGRSIEVETDGMVHSDLKEWLGVAPLALIAQRVSANAAVVGDKTGYTLTTAEQDLIIDKVWDEVLTGATHNVTNSSGRRLRAIQEFQGYELGAIWIDTVNGVAGTTDFENGTVDNPVNSIADANTLATSLGISRFEMASNSSITFAASQENQQFDGENWTLALGGQSIDGTHIEGATISGIGTGVCSLFRCHLGACSFGGGDFEDLGFGDTFTVTATGDYQIFNCYHNESGTASTIDFGAAVGASEVHVHNWHGNLIILNMGAGDILHFTSSNGTLTMDSTCTAGTRNSAGTFGLTDNSSGMTVNDLGQMYQRVGAPSGADIAADIASRAAPGASMALTAAAINLIWDELTAEARVAGSYGQLFKDNLDAILSDIETDTQDIQSRLPAALVSSRMDSSVGAMAANVLTAAAIAAAALTDAKFAADAFDNLFQRDIDAVEAAAPVHSLTTAILKAVSRVRDNVGTLEIYRTDGLTVHASQAVTVDSGLDPVDELAVSV